MDGADSVPDGAVVIKVAVVDDDPLVLDGLTTILGVIADIEVIATATDGAAATDLVERHRGDLDVLFHFRCFAVVSARHPRLGAHTVRLSRMNTSMYARAWSADATSHSTWFWTDPGVR